ncbi:uncharacterized protein LAJ45_05414 [Morchella importuna]|uniref:BHLH domain-containing protein n=1 Tax=Morchella conica CCBAS932 TaxID=1392247 RepID=A0A3N4KBF1_9PEZI|nr:uncharacterized protein LAJ45_05414 [Morchella importuna]KAH8150718.1 hypothetical protein LAJ45_05414 [Morchella importuna]RPB07830.1 hypothetical protein P167DRAFT_386820 [Morchella conica CCBAS932]
MSMITSKSSSNQALPPLSSLMRDCVHPRPGRMDGSEIEHEYHSFREGQPTVIEPSRLEAFQGRYPQHLLQQQQQQQQQQHSSHLLLPTHNAMGPAHLPHAESHYSNVPEMEGIRYAMQISPISPRTRCPSLSESILSSTGCTSPGSHSPTTPVSERGAPAYGDGRGNATGSSYQHVQRNSHRYQQTHHHHQQHRISKSYQSSSVRIHGSISPHSLPMRSSLPGNSEHKKSKHEIRRIKHLNSEKKRRETIKDGMEALFKLVPECTDKGTSKANILKMTKEFIVELHEGTTSLQMEIRRLGKENEDMRRYIKQQQEPRKYTCRL